MKQYQVNKAYRTLMKMNDVEMPAKAAYRIHMLTRKLEPAYECELALEKRLLEKYSGKLEANGDIIFAPANPYDAQDKAAGFYEELHELNQEEADVLFDPVVLTWDDVREVKMSPAMVASLDGFVLFE